MVTVKCSSNPEDDEYSGTAAGHCFRHPPLFSTMVTVADPSSTNPVQIDPF